MNTCPNDMLLTRQSFDDDGTAFGIRSAEYDGSFADGGIRPEDPHGRFARPVVA